MSNALDPDSMTDEKRLGEVACILAAGFLRLKCRRGYIPDTPPAPPEPPPHGHAFRAGEGRRNSQELSGCPRALTP